MRLDDPRLADARRRDPAACRRSSRSSRSRPTTGCSSRPRCIEDGEIRHVHRKLFLPTYGLFDERRFFAAGDVLRAVPSRLGVGIGIAVCEDFWHLAVPQLAGARRRPDPHQRLVVAGSRPGGDQRGRSRDGDLVADADADLRPADDVVRDLLQPRRRRRVDLVLGRLRGHRARPATRSSARRSTTRGCSWSTSRWPTSGASGSPCRCCATSGPSSRSASWRGSSPSGPAWRRDTTAEPDAEPGLDVAPATDRAPIGVADGERRRRPARPTDDRRPPTAPFELPAELAIDTDVARRVIGEFIRGQLRQAGFERAVLGLSGGIDSALVAYLVAEAIGADRLLCVLMPYRTSSPASRADAETVVAALGCASELVDISPMVDGYFGRATGRGRRRCDALRRGNFMARMRMAVLYDRSVTLGRARRRDRQQDRVADRLHDALRRLRLRVQPDRRPVQEPGPPAGRRIGVPDAIVRKAPVGRPVAGPDRRGRGRVQLPGARPAAVLAGRQAPLDRGDGRARASTPALVERVDRMVAGAEFKRQVPPIAKLGPRTAGVDYLYPRRRPGSARG